MSICPVPSTISEIRTGGSGKLTPLVDMSQSSGTSRQTQTIRVHVIFFYMHEEFYAVTWCFVKRCTMFILVQFFISQNLNNVWVRMEGYNWSWSVVGIQYACKVQYRSTDTESVTPNSELHKQRSTMH
jgi:hypothetical protein